MPRGLRGRAGLHLQDGQVVQGGGVARVAPQGLEVGRPRRVRRRRRRPARPRSAPGRRCCSGRSGPPRGRRPAGWPPPPGGWSSAQARERARWLAEFPGSRSTARAGQPDRLVDPADVEADQRPQAQRVGVLRGQGQQPLRGVQGLLAARPAPAACARAARAAADRRGCWPGPHRGPIAPSPSAGRRPGPRAGRRGPDRHSNRWAFMYSARGVYSPAWSANSTTLRAEANQRPVEGVIAAIAASRSAGGDRPGPRTRSARRRPAPTARRCGTRGPGRPRRSPRSGRPGARRRRPGRRAARPGASAGCPHAPGRPGGCDEDGAVEAAGATQGAVDVPRRVGRSQDEDPLVLAGHAVELGEQLVDDPAQGRGRAAQPGAGATERVDLVEEQHARRLGAGVGEEVGDVVLALAHPAAEHVREPDGDEPRAELAGDGPGQVGLATAGRAVEQQPAAQGRPVALAQLRVAQRGQEGGLDVRLDLRQPADVGQAQLGLHRLVGQPAGEVLLGGPPVEVRVRGARAQAGRVRGRGRWSPARRRPARWPRVRPSPRASASW